MTTLRTLCDSPFEERYRAAMDNMTEAGHRVRQRIYQRKEGPELLYDAWKAGELPERTDVGSLVEEAWITAVGDRPEELLSSERWVELFRAAGFFKSPTNLPNLPTPLVIYRGAVEGRKRRMAWSTDIEVARQHRQRNINNGYVGRLYRTEIDPRGALAYLSTWKREMEVVVDLAFLGDPEEIS